MLTLVKDSTVDVHSSSFTSSGEGMMMIRCRLDGMVTSVFFLSQRWRLSLTVIKKWLEERYIRSKGKKRASLSLSKFVVVCRLSSLGSFGSLSKESCP